MNFYFKISYIEFKFIDKVVIPIKDPFKTHGPIRPIGFGSGSHFLRPSGYGSGLDLTIFKRVGSGSYWTRPRPDP
jgi:hypothetical protein